MRWAPDFIILEKKLVHDTLPSEDAPKHQIGDSYRKQYKIYVTDTIILKPRSAVKVTVTPKWYTTCHNPKMYPYTKFRFPT